MNPIYTFTEEYEREFAVANREFDIAMTEAVMESAEVRNRLKINMALSELKVMQENGTASDLAELILEAGEEAAEENRGILAKVFDAIAKFFKGIANGIQKFFSGNKEGIAQLKAQNETVTVDSKTNSMLEALQNAESKMTEASNAKDYTAFKVAIAAAVTAGAGAALYAVFNKTGGKLRENGEAASTVEIPAAEAEKKLAWVGDLGNKVNGLFEKAKSFFTKNKGDIKDGEDTQASTINPELQKRADARKATKAAEQAKVNQAQASVNQRYARDERITNGIKNWDKRQAALNNSTRYDNMTDDEKAIQKSIDRNKAKVTANHFIGMFEAGENATGGNGNADETNSILGFLRTITITATNFLENALNTALSKLKNAAKGAAPEAAAAGSNFLGAEMKESGSEVDPIEAMLSGLAFGGYHG